MVSVRFCEVAYKVVPVLCVVSMFVPGFVRLGHILGLGMGDGEWVSSTVSRKNDASE